MKKSINVKLGDFLKAYRIELKISSTENYKQVTISKTGTVSFRHEKSGSEIGRKRQFWVDLKKHPHTVMFTRQGVLEGAIGLAPESVDQCVVTENMPTLAVDVKIISIGYLKALLVSEYLFEKIRVLTAVGSAQKSIHERDLLNVEIELPDIKTQKQIAQKFANIETQSQKLTAEITNQQTLIKKLRRQILQEAIEGKLTVAWRKQNRTVESADELLKRITAEKARLIKNKQLKKQKPLPVISDAEKPFVLPKGWVWCRLGDVSINSLGKMLDSAKNKGELKPYLRNLNVRWFYVDTSDLSQMRFENNEMEKYSVQKGDIVICEGGYPGRAAIWNKDEPIMFQKAVHRVRFISDCFSSVLFVNLLWLLSSSGEMDNYCTGSGIRHLTGKALNKIIIPLPPLPEQKAIVTSVKKLLTLCDRLETQITQNESYAEQLMQAVLKETFGN